MSAADIQAGLNKLDAKLVSSYTGGAVTIAQGMNAVARRRVIGPQYAITHTREIEYIIVTKGSGTMVTGGTLIPPTIDKATSIPGSECHHPQPERSQGWS